MPVLIAIDLDQLQLSTESEAILDALGDLTPLFKALGHAAHGLWNEKFRREGPGWVPLAEATLEKRRKAGKGAEILKDDGKLFGSLTDAASEGAVYELNDKSLTIGTNLEYAAVHQFGSRDGRIPQRAFLPDEKEVVSEFERVIKQYFARLGK